MIGNRDYNILPIEVSLRGLCTLVGATMMFAALAMIFGYDTPKEVSLAFAGFIVSAGSFYAFRRYTVGKGDSISEAMFKIAVLLVPPILTVAIWMFALTGGIKPLSDSAYTGAVMSMVASLALSASFTAAECKKQGTASGAIITFSFFTMYFACGISVLISVASLIV